MSVAAVQSATAATGSSAPPAPPPLSSVQQGDVAAGRAKVVEGQVFAVCPAGQPCDAPAVARWGDQPAGSAYRQTFDAVAARIGTREPASVAAEIERQLGVPASPAGAQEGVGAFFDGAVRGDFGDNDSWSATAGQVVAGLIPGVGQLADARDTIASAGKVLRGDEGGWTALGASVVGWVPGVGDAAKAAIRGGDKLADAGAEVAQHAARNGDEAAAGAARKTADAAPRERIEMDGGGKGDWPKELNARELKPNADYVVNGYHYATDEQGRVTSVEGKLDLRTAERNGYQQQVSGREDRLPDDQGGHLIASIFNGPGDRLNLVPMNGNLNTGAWKKVENRLADALKDGKSVEAKVEVVYGAGSQRPDQFVITYKIDGGRPVVAEFDNVAGGRK